MDNKFTKKRIQNMLSYDWIKMLVMVLAIVLVWSLAFTIGAPRATEGQVFYFYYYVGDSKFNYKKDPSELCAEYFSENNKLFSYDVLDYGTRVITSTMYSDIMATSTAVAEGDVMITIDSEEGIKNNTSEMRNVLDGYGHCFYDYDTLINAARHYCLKGGFVVENNDGTYSINEKKIEEHFEERMADDPRFRDTKSQRYAQGIKDEIARIKTVWNNAVILGDCFKNHPEILIYYTRYTQYIEKYTKDPANANRPLEEEYYQFTSKPYALNLGALTGNDAVKITDEYSKPIKEGEEADGLSADGIVMLVYNYDYAQPYLQFETLALVRHYIARYSNFLNVNASGVIA